MKDIENRTDVEQKCSINLISMKGKENFMKNVDLEQYLLIIQGME